MKKLVARPAISNSYSSRPTRAMRSGSPRKPLMLLHYVRRSTTANCFGRNHRGPAAIQAAIK
jgi:hypothetical protein